MSLLRKTDFTSCTQKILTNPNSLYLAKDSKDLSGYKTQAPVNMYLHKHSKSWKGYTPKFYRQLSLSTQLDKEEGKVCISTISVSKTNTSYYIRFMLKNCQSPVFYRNFMFSSKIIIIKLD